MTKIDVYNLDGSVAGQIELSNAVFGIEPNREVMHMVVKNQLANRRQGTSSTKTRSEVRGGGKRPWRQKGTGRARHGSTRSAQYVGGGVIFGPKPRDYSFTLPKKVRRLAIKSALSTKLLEQKLVVVKNFELAEGKTRLFAGVLKALKVENTALVVSEAKNENLERASRNLVGVKLSRVNTINVFDLLKYDSLLISQAAVETLQEVYA